MERYRVGLIFAAQEFDTYKAIEKYAKHPRSADAVIGFEYLLRCTRRRVLWEALKAGGPDALDTMQHIYLGTSPTSGEHSGKQLTMDAFASMSNEQRDTLFSAMCKSVGLDIDPETLVNARQHQTTGEHSTD